MSNEQAFLRIKTELDAHNQSHLLAFWDSLDSKKQKNLCRQIEKLDFDQLDQRIQDFVIHDRSVKMPPD